MTEYYMDMVLLVSGLVLAILTINALFLLICKLKLSTRLKILDYIVRIAN